MKGIKSEEEVASRKKTIKQQPRESVAVVVFKYKLYKTQKIFRNTLAFLQREFVIIPLWKRILMHGIIKRSGSKSMGGRNHIEKEKYGGAIQEQISDQNKMVQVTDFNALY